jgi:hypothetical protein
MPSKIDMKKAAGAAFLLRMAKHLQPIDQNVQTQPHHIHKVPIPSGTFKSKMAVGRKMALL